MERYRGWAVWTGALLLPAAAYAQPADLPIPAATTTQYPPGVSIRQTDAGAVYVDAAGHTLYGMDLRTLVRWSPEPALYCQNACAQLWQPLLAPADAKVNIAYPRGFGERPPPRPSGSSPAAAGDANANANANQPRQPGQAPTPPGFITPQQAPDWTVMTGPQGPQWVYKGWHLVYTRKGDAPGSTEYDGADALTWNSLKFIPPVPQITAPVSVSTIVVSGTYALADKAGHVLFTGDCRNDCAAWLPLAGAAASMGVGQWRVSLTGDRPQWTYRGKPVFVSQDDDPAAVPLEGVILRP